MKCREAIKILMESPIYWRLTIKERRDLVREYCQSVDAHDETIY